MLAPNRLIGGIVAHADLNAFKKIAAPFSSHERDAMFFGTASRVYRLAS
jgi:hypothetical protein